MMWQSKRFGILLTFVLAATGVKAVDPPLPADKQAEKLFSQAVEKAREDLLMQFEAAIGKAIEKGDLSNVQSLKAERDEFAKDVSALPVHPLMLKQRSTFEAVWWEAKGKWDQALNKAVVELTKSKKFDEAKRVQGVADEVAKSALLPQDVLTQLPGTWRVSFIGRTLKGSNINYQATWIFDKANTVRSDEAKLTGRWTYDYKTRRVVITWDNSEKSQEAFPVPLKPSGLTGQTWHGIGVKFTAVKAVPK